MQDIVDRESEDYRAQMLKQLPQTITCARALAIVAALFDLLDVKIALG